MEIIDSQRQKMNRAKERVEALKGFYSHLTAYLVIIPLLALLNYFTNDFKYVWFVWAAAGWGIGLLIHAGGVFWFRRLWGHNWEERKIKEFMEND